MENNEYVELKTMDNTKIRVLKKNVGAIEEIPASSRTEGYVKVYTAGFAFQLSMSFDEVTKAIYG